MIRLFKWLVEKSANLFDRSNDDTTCHEFSRRGDTVVVRDYKDLMFHVVDIAADGGPELVGEYAIYSSAVIAAELWEYSKRKKAEAVPVLRIGGGSP